MRSSFDAQVAGPIASVWASLTDVDGVVSYTLVDVGDDEITSLGVFKSESAATTTNELAVAWAKKRLASLGAAPLDAARLPASQM